MNGKRGNLFQALAAGCVAVAMTMSVGGSAVAQDKGVLVFAAASLKDALDEIVTTYGKTSGKTVSVSYAGSSALAKQVEAGAPADIFISADTDWMDYVQNKHLILDTSRVSLLGNKLVLVAPKAAAVSLTVGQGMPFSDPLGKDGHLAMATIDSVPAGKYGKEALTSLGVWDAVSARVVQAADVRTALTLVTRGEANFGIVYLTDANAEPGVKVVGTFPESSHVPIVYPAAVTAVSKNTDTQAFFDYLRSAAARASFEKQGFTVLAAAK